MDLYECEGTIGEGTYGIVIKARHKRTGNVVAIKKFKESDEDEQVRKTAFREIRILKQLNKHPHVVSLNEVFRRKGKLYLVFEYVERTILEDLERHPTGLDALDAKKYLYQLLHSLAYCHDHNVIHRDIKPENCLVSKNGVVKLCDFGFARAIARPGGKYTDYVATRWYRAPELLVGDRNYGKPVDVWAVGCMFAEMLTGVPLFAGETDLDQLGQIIQVAGPLPETQKELFARNPIYVGVSLPEFRHTERLSKRLNGIDKLALDLIKQCLRYDPDTRPTCQQLLRKHPYFDGFSDWFDVELRHLVDLESGPIPGSRSIRTKNRFRHYQHHRKHPNAEAERMYRVLKEKTEENQTEDVVSAVEETQDVGRAALENDIVGTGPRPVTPRKVGAPRLISFPTLAPPGENETGVQTSGGQSSQATSKFLQAMKLHKYSTHPLNPVHPRWNSRHPAASKSIYNAKPTSKFGSYPHYLQPLAQEGQPSNGVPTTTGERKLQHFYSKFSRRFA